MPVLHDYQQRIVNEAPDKWGFWLSCGLGKSAICISLMEKNLPHDSIIIITTKSLKENWKNEVKKWSKKNEYSFIIRSKEEFRRDYKTLPRVNGLIIDEAHFVGNFKSQIHKALLQYIKVRHPRFIYLATATPIMSEVWSVWSLSKILGKEVLPFWKFKQKYFIEIKMGNRRIPVQKKGIEEQIASDLRSFGTVLHTKDVLGPEDVIHETEYFKQNKEQERAVMDIDEDPTSINHMTYYTKCLQIASGTLKLDDKGGFKTIPCDKLERVKELVEQYPNICIVAKHTAELRMLQDNLKGSFIYDGHTKEEERQRIIDQINTKGGVLLLQADSGVGFNLEKVNLIVFYSHTFDFIKYSQCLGRNGGLRQKGRNTYLHLITSDTIDEDVWECLERKTSFDISLYNRKKNENNSNSNK